MENWKHGRVGERGRKSRTKIGNNKKGEKNVVGTLYPQKLALTSPTSGGRSVGIVRSRTKATEFCFSFKIRYRGKKKK
jgi:hypothetical protein